MVRFPEELKLFYLILIKFVRLFEKYRELREHHQQQLVAKTQAFN